MAAPGHHGMPIQILRAIFVAIKYRVFGLMGQKYSILSEGRSFRPGVSRNRDKFVGLDEGREGVGQVYDTAGVVDTFTSRLTHSPEETERAGRSFTRIQAKERALKRDLQIGSGRSNDSRTYSFVVPFLAPRCFVPRAPVCGCGCVC